MDQQVRKWHGQLPVEVRREILAVTGYCRLSERGICLRCAAIEREAVRRGLAS